MLRFERPKKPRGFAASMRVAEAAVRKQIDANLDPQFDERLWKAHKATFLAAQHDKCGYCEAYSVNHPGSVEHYAPKSRVEELAEPGSENAPGTSVTGRVMPIVCKRGYWWLAYSWNNWLFACERCNTAWKSCLFPVRKSPRANPPRREVRERHLLLNPFDRIDPVDHLHFSRLGQIAARNSSEHGTATIQTCGLDRESLRRIREHIALDVHRHLRRLIEAMSADNFLTAYDATVDLLALGGEARAHAGMVRSIVLSESGRSWNELHLLNERLAALAAPTSPASPPPARRPRRQPAARRGRGGATAGRAR